MKNKIGYGYVNLFFYFKKRLNFEKKWEGGG